MGVFTLPTIWTICFLLFHKPQASSNSGNMDGNYFQVAVHVLGKKAVLLGETAETSGFKLKPAESQPVGRSQDEEFWNEYQDLQQLSRNTHKETEPMCERGKELHDNFFLLGAVIVICPARTL